jgi:hypothetical protein
VDERSCQPRDPGHRRQPLHPALEASGRLPIVRGHALICHRR